MKTLHKRFSQSAVTQALALACAAVAFGSPLAFADDSDFTANVSIVSTNTCQPTITLPTTSAFSQTLDISTVNSTASYTGYTAPTPDAGMLTKIEMSTGCSITEIHAVLRHMSSEAKPWTYTVATPATQFQSPAGNGMLTTYAEPTAIHLYDSDSNDVSVDYTATTGGRANGALAAVDTPFSKIGAFNSASECKSQNITGPVCIVQGYTKSNRAGATTFYNYADAWNGSVNETVIRRKTSATGSAATAMKVGVAMMAGSVPRDMSGAADYFVIPNGTTIVDSYQLILSLA